VRSKEFVRMEAHEIDPTQAVSPSINRRVFVGISAAAGAAPVLALADQDLGKPHPPLVSESDPAISVERVTLDRPDGTVSAYAAWPAEATATTPSVVVIMHIWGVDAQIRDTVRRYAKAGFAAIAPDLYSRWDPPNGDGATDYAPFRALSQKLEPAQYVGDIEAAAHWLRSKFSGTKVGITGFCMGGHLVLVALTDTGTLFAAAAPFYGAPEGIDPKAIRIPICGSYGARDTSIPADSVRAFAAALTVPNDIRIYDEAGHAFFDDTRPRYVATAAADAWKRTIAFFHKYLGGTTT
jgi:carboxymethylenebutenolidase